MKIVVKIIISRLPLAYRFWKKLGLFEHGQMNNQSYAVDVFFEHIKRSGLEVSNLEKKIILELGPGDSISTAIIASCFGGKVILVDSGSFVSEDISIYINLEEYLAKLGYKPPPISECKNMQEILKLCDSELYLDGLNSLKEIADSSVDFIFSHAVLEHIRKFEFLETMKETKRILKRKGCSSHQVDLKDHLGGGLNNLRFSEKLWESSLFSESGFYTNRISHTEMLKLFKEAGFNVELIEVKEWKELPIKIKKLANDFKNNYKDDRLISGFSVLLTIPEPSSA